MSEYAGMTKAELLRRIETSWNALNQQLELLSVAQLTELKDAGGWSIKDHLAHISAWESTVDSILENRHAGDALGVPRAVWESADIGAINDILQKQSAALALEQVIVAFQSTHERVLARLAAVSEADLQRPINAFVPPAPPRSTPLSWTANNTYGHYDEHREWIENLVESAG